MPIDVTASRPLDYTIDTSPITVNAGDMTKILTISIVDDDDIETTEMFFLLLQPGNVFLTVIIMDNDVGE